MGRSGPSSTSPWICRRAGRSPWSGGTGGRGTLAGSDDRRFTSMEVRFAKPVFPGQALTVMIWPTGPGEAVYTTENDNGEVVISEGRVTFIE
jgi:MaoC like domain